MEREWMTRAAPMRLTRMPGAPLTRVGATGPATGPAPLPPTMNDGYGPYQSQSNAASSTKKFVIWGTTLVGMASGAFYGYARGGLFPALGYGVLGNVVGMAAGYLVGNLVTNPTQTPMM